MEANTERRRANDLNQLALITFSSNPGTTARWTTHPRVSGAAPGQEQPVLETEEPEPWSHTEARHR